MDLTCRKRRIVVLSLSSRCKCFCVSQHHYIRNKPEVISASSASHSWFIPSHILSSKFVAISRTSKPKLNLPFLRNSQFFNIIQDNASKVKPQTFHATSPLRPKSWLSAGGRSRKLVEIRGIHGAVKWQVGKPALLVHIMNFCPTEEMFPTKRQSDRGWPHFAELLSTKL